MEIFDKELFSYHRLEVCEALGEDGAWYAATIERKNADCTYCVCLRDYPARWRAVGAHNLRKQKQSIPFVKKFLQPRHERMSTGEEYMPTEWFFSSSENTQHHVQIDSEETFDEFAEPRRISTGNTFIPEPKLSIAIQADETSEFEEKPLTRRRVRIRTNETFTEFDEQRPRVSFVNSDESFAEDLPPSIPAFEQDPDAEGFTIHHPLSPTVPMCLNPFSFFMFSEIATKPKTKRKAKKFKRRPKRKRRTMMIRDSIQEGIRRGSNLCHGSETAWTLEELEQYKAEIEAELNRLRNKSIGAGVPSDAQNFNLRRGTTNEYVSIHSSRLLSAGEHDTESVIFQRKMEETMEIDFQRRIWLSNQWDVDCVTIQAKWRPGDMVEMFRNGEWVPAVVHSCSAENNIAWLLLQTNAKSETHHKLPRFGNHVRPYGYIEPEVME